MESKSSVIDKIRKDKSIAAENRRDVAALAAAGLADFCLISLLQLGYFKSFPTFPEKHLIR